MKKLAQKIFPLEIPVNRIFILYLLAKQDDIPQWFTVLFGLCVMIQLATTVLIWTSEHVNENYPFNSITK